MPRNKDRFSSFPRGTKVKMTDGKKKRVEDLKPGDEIATSSGSATVTGRIDPLSDVSASLLVKLGSIAVHADEMMSPQGHMVDKYALKTLLEDKEVTEWLASMNKLAMLPVKR
jgi:preprotein translocase subunit YajC